MDQSEGSGHFTSLTTHVDSVSSLAEANVVSTDYENIQQKAFFTICSKPDGSSSIIAYYLSKEGKVEGLHDDRHSIGYVWRHT